LTRTLIEVRRLELHDTEDFSKRTMEDPVAKAQKSTFLRLYMSNNPETLFAYAKWYGKVKGKISSVEITAIETKVSDRQYYTV
jgi:hypothetical protein